MRFGVDQELAAGDDGVARRDAGHDLDVVAEVGAERDLARLEAALCVAHDHDGALAGTDHGFRGQHQPLGRRPGDGHPQQHAGHQPAGAVVDLEAGLERARRGAHLRQDLLQLAFEGAARVGLQHGPDLLATHQMHRLCFGHFGHGPHRLEAGDAIERGPRRDRHAIAHAQLGDHAVCRRGQREPCLRGTGGEAASHHLVGNRQHAQPVSRSRHELGRRARSLQRDELVLRPDPVGREDGGQRLPLAHALHECTHREMLDVAGDARLHGHVAALVELHRTHRIERRRDRRAAYRGHAQAEALLHGRAHLHAAGGAIALAALRIDRHELHVHERRLAGFVETLARNHRVVPVENDGLGRRGGAARRRGARGHRAGRVGAADDERSCRHQHEGGGQGHDAEALHGAAPASIGR